MLATVLQSPGNVVLEEVPDPKIQLGTDAIVEVAAAGVCGSDLNHYRGGHFQTQFPKRMGHEFVGVVTEVGSEVSTLSPGDFVVASFSVCDGTCRNCRNGQHSACEVVTYWGDPDHCGYLADGAQGEKVRVPYADAVLVKVNATVPDSMLRDLLAATDSLATGYHAAASGRVDSTSSVVVVGDGPVGLCAVLAAKLLGARRIILMSKYPSRQRMAIEFGATDIVEKRGPAGVADVRELLDGSGADVVLECVGGSESFGQAIDVVRPGGVIESVGVPNFDLPTETLRRLFFANTSIHFAVAESRAYLPTLISHILSGAIQPGRIFDATVELATVAEAYRLMDQRKAIKVMLKL